MKITRNRPPSRQAPSDHFTGLVWVDEIAVTEPPARLRAYTVHFTPAAHTAWHHHPYGQVLHVLEGAGLVQRRGGDVEGICASDTVRFDPQEWHLHGAGPTAFMTHLAMQEADNDGVDAHWGTHVSDDEYPYADKSGSQSANHS